MRAPLVTLTGAVGVTVYAPMLPEGADFLALSKEFDEEADNYEAASKAFRGIANHLRREGEKLQKKVDLFKDSK